MIRHLILKTCVAAAAAMAIIGGTAQAQTINIKFSHVTAPDTPKGKAIDHFARLVAERSNGRIEVEVYPNSQLYKDKEELEALQLGAVQMLAPSLGKFGPMGLREFDVFNLPFLFTTAEQAHSVFSSDIGVDLLKRLETKGITGLAYWDNGFYVMTANRPLLWPDDFFGMQMRVQSSRVSEAQIRALGGIPQTVAFSEVYQALQTGVIDGADYPTLTNLWTQRICEVQRDITLSNHSYLGYAVVANAEFWNGLESADRSLLETALADATEVNNAQVAADTARARSEIEATGRCTFHELNEKQQQAWREALLPVHESVTDRIGEDVIQAVYRAAGFNSGQ